MIQFKPAENLVSILIHLVPIIIGPNSSHVAPKFWTGSQKLDPTNTRAKFSAGIYIVLSVTNLLQVVGYRLQIHQNLLYPSSHLSSPCLLHHPLAAGSPAAPPSSEVVEWSSLVQRSHPRPRPSLGLPAFPSYLDLDRI